MPSQLPVDPLNHASPSAFLLNLAEIDHEPYRYEPLYKTTPSIRLVSILPTNESGELHLDLEVVSLAAAANDYSAVSYTWGPGPAEHRVWIGDEFLLLRSSIWRFLKHCCKTEVHGKTKLWTDSICIDQDNVLEKNSQIQLMKDIFQNADKVFVWLSEASESGIDRLLSQCCYEEFPRWRRNTDSPGSSFRESFDAFMSQTYNPRSGGCVPPSRDALAAAVGIIDKCEYWTRLWVVQEFALPRRLLFILGPCTFRAALIGGLNSWKHSLYYDKVTEYNRAAIVSELFSLRRRERPSRLGYLLEHFSEQHCQNPKDHVYGLLGLIEPSATLLVDYEITNEESFAQSIELLSVRDRRNAYYHRWGYHAKILSRALDVSTESCLAYPKLQAAGREPPDLLSQRYELPLQIKVRMVPLVPVLVPPNPHSPFYSFHQFVDLESGDISDERFISGESGFPPAGLGLEEEGLVELRLPGFLSFVLRPSMDGRSSVKCLVPFLNLSDTLFPCLHAKWLPNGLVT